LESGGRVSQAKEHDGWFEEALASFEGSFVLVTFLDANVIVSPANVKLGKEAFLCKIVD